MALHEFDQVLDVLGASVARLTGRIVTQEAKR